FWRHGGQVSIYANRTLAPVEVVILVRYRESVSGRVLELGCGGGRVLGYLVALGGQVHGIDLSAEMVDYCHSQYPDADIRVGDMSSADDIFGGKFDAIIAASNILDVYDQDERRQTLAALREMLTSDGLLIFSSHNLAHLDGHAQLTDAGAEPARSGGLGLVVKVLERSPVDLVRAASRLPRRLRNRRRLAPLQRRTADHAIVNDDALDYGTLHYYVRRDDQVRQLDELGYDVVDVLDPWARSVGPGEPGQGAWLHYIARPREGTLTSSVDDAD
ncbi:MAG: class I SAM-dependent methyltransferase, partial [Solirubrobacteraceae bacterium]